MGRTVQIQGSDEVMAMFGKVGTFYRGKWENMRITKPDNDEDVPLEVRTALVGLTVPTIFTKESIEEKTGATFPIPERSRLAYCADVIDVLRSAGKHKEAELLQNTAKGILDMYVVRPEVYELLSSHN
ncbi:MAG: hypothetical protein V2A62_04405 [Candidatus Woesearchaeota archaeon]